MGPGNRSPFEGFNGVSSDGISFDAQEPAGATDRRVVRIWSGCKALVVLDLGPQGDEGIVVTGSLGAPNYDGPVDVELDPWAQLTTYNGRG